MSQNTIIDSGSPIRISAGGTGSGSSASGAICFINYDGVSNYLDMVHSLNDGQLLIGKDGDLPQIAYLTGNAGITITNGSGSIGIGLTVPVSTTNGGTGVSIPIAHGLLITQGTSPMSSVVLSAGQVLVGSTSADPVGATISGDNLISVTSTSGAISVNTAPYNSVTSSTQQIDVNSIGYVSNDGGNLVTYTLPATANFGTYVDIVGYGAGGWRVSQNAGQQIVGTPSSATTLGTSGFIASQKQYDAVRLVCTEANSIWVCMVLTGVPTFH